MTTLIAQPQSPRRIAAMTTYATDLARAYPRASADELALKLLTVFDGADLALRLTVAGVAIGAAAHQLAA